MWLNVRRWLGRLFCLRGLLVIAGLFVCCYSLGVLWYAQTLLDLGIRSAFSPVVKHFHGEYLPEGKDLEAPKPEDTIVEVGREKVKTWRDLVWAPIHLKETLAREKNAIPELRGSQFDDSKIQKWGICRDGPNYLVRVRFRREVPGHEDATFTTWLFLKHLPFKEVIPSILWFLLKLLLFLVGALVFWKRPNDRAATQFFALCIVTLGAYMGGYHWSHIVTQPVLILGFIVCSVLLPVVSLHFNLLFPRPKAILERRPRATILAVYGLPLAFLVLLVIGYISIRLTENVGHLTTLLSLVQLTIYFYLGVAGLWYLAGVLCLVHSFRTVTDATEHNQVKWIMFGALAALVPISYSLYLAVWDPESFGGGAATVPMFVASVCFTIAFAVSITRYRLMELDQILSSGAIYFAISFLAGLGYYGVVFLGTLVSNQMIAGPSWTHALTASSTALVLLLVLDFTRSRFKKALDRRFSRQKLQLDRTLQRMGEAIEQLVDPPTLAQRFLQASSELLGVPRGSVYLREGEPPIYRLAGNLGDPPPLTELSSGCPLIEALRIREVVCCRGGGASPFHQSSAPAQRQLRFLGGEVAQALAHEDRLLALLILGPRNHDPFRSEELSILGAFAQITVLALESAAGHRTIEVLNRDLQSKVEKISEQQRRILALQTQLRKRASDTEGPAGTEAEAAAQLPERGPAGSDDPIVGSSVPVRHLLDLIRKVSVSEAVVLIRGESGTGKELLARAVHDHSPRAQKPFVKVHCAALSQGLLESELFGHVRGAFTGAHRDKVGRFEMANGGTLFLDEIGDINLEVQTKLLRVLQEMTFERVGSSEPIQVDVRVITATHQNLEQLIQLGRFRHDLYYRLNVISIPVPPLRDRIEDIPELALFFLRRFAQRAGRPAHQIDDDALALLKAHRWPGNIRELENVIERAVVVAEEGVVTARELPVELVNAVMGSADGYQPAKVNGSSPLVPPALGIQAEREQYDRHERERLVRALAAADGNKAEAARALGLARSTLLSRLKKLGLS
jgi:transcriptional regulator with GAF, ATPase, and Fis domain